LTAAAEGETIDYIHSQRWGMEIQFTDREIDVMEVLR